MGCISGTKETQGQLFQKQRSGKTIHYLLTDNGGVDKIFPCLYDELVIITVVRLLGQENNGYVDIECYLCYKIS